MMSVMRNVIYRVEFCGKVLHDRKKRRKRVGGGGGPKKLELVATNKSLVFKAM